MPRVAIISDTHVPTRADEVPSWVVDELGRADHTIHAGDFDSRKAYGRIESLANGLTAVRGNTDSPTIDLPRIATVEIGGVTFAVTHGSGSPTGWAQRVVETVGAESGDRDRDPVAVAGHTHEVVDETVDGTQILNPGSATGAAPADRTSMYVATVEDGEVTVDLRTGTD